MAAPAAQVDEDWQEFNEFKPVSGDLNRVDELSSNDSNFLSNTGDCSDLYNSLSVEIYSFKSMEDLVHSFDEKLTVCFKSYDITTENIVPAITPITEDDFLEDDRVWNALTDNYGNVMPVDWRTSHTRSLHLPTLNLLQHGKLDNSVLDMSDDEELRDQMDMHSIIVSCINDEPLFTAEQVIEEIEEMMQESPDPEDDVSPSRSDLYMLSQDLHTLSQDLQTLQRSSSNTSYEDRLRHLTVSELTEALEEVEIAIRRYSEELISALALRDELEYEKEVKNSFISLLIDVQNRQKEHRELLRKKRFRTTTTTTTTGTLGVNSQRVNTHIPGTYLTTVIPYEKKAGSPSVEDLQILTKILRAMRDDSEKVPSLLTDYILKVLCPT